MSDLQQRRFEDCVLRNANNRAILERMPALGLPDWWLAAGALFQTVWNVLAGRPATQGIRDYDLFYFDATDLTAAGQRAVGHAVDDLFADLDVAIEVCNEARVHLWYEEEFGVPAQPFASSRDAVDHFAATTCCYAITSDRGSRGLGVYAPHGYDDLFALRVRPNPVLAPREVYERKSARWRREWPGLTVEPWPSR